MGHCPKYGILDSEECIDPLADFDGNGIPDCQDTGTARLMPTTRADTVLLHTSHGALRGIEAMSHDDPRLSTVARPSAGFPNGAVRFKVVELDGAAPETVTLTMVFPDSLSADAQIYLIDSDGWHEVPFERSSSETSRIMLSLTDNGPYDQDPNTGSIMVTGALAVGGSGDGGSNGGGSLSSSG